MDSKDSRNPMDQNALRDLSKALSQAAHSGEQLEGDLVRARGHLKELRNALVAIHTLHMRLGLVPSFYPIRDTDAED